jgi:hypothetical protein
MCLVVVYMLGLCLVVVLWLRSRPVCPVVVYMLGLHVVVVYMLRMGLVVIALPPPIVIVVES